MDSLLSSRTHVGRGTSILVALLAGSSACADVENTDDESHLDALPVLEAEEVTRIGSFDDPDVGFTSIFGVDVDRGGAVYVMEASVPEIRVYDTNGQVVRRIGRRGEGPGEFKSAPEFGVRGDTVWAVDRSIVRITLFDRQGNVLSTGRTDGVAVPLPLGYGWVFPRSMRPDGKFVGWLSRVSYRRDDETGVEPTDSIPVPFVLFDAAAMVTDTLGWLGRPPPRMWRPPWEDDTSYETIDIAGRREEVPRPPTTLPWWNHLSDGHLTVETPLATSPEDGVLAVTRIGASGDTVFSRRIHYRPVGYSDIDLDSIAARAARGEPGGMVGFIPGAPVPDDWEVAARALRYAMSFPDFQLPLEYPWVAQDESVWLRLRPVEGSGTATWVVLDPQGRPRGQLELPSDLRLQWSRGDTLWASDPDELDVEWLVRLVIGEADEA